MATKAKSKKSAPKSATASFKNPFQINSDYQREVLFISAIGAAAYYFTALFSFSPLDPSWVSSSFPEAKALNLAGQLGANISGYAIYCLGLGSYLIPLPGLTTATLIMARAEKPRSSSRLFGWALAILISIAFAAGHLSPLIFKEYPLPSGGFIGTYVYELLNRVFGGVGTNIFLTTFAVTSLMLISRSSFIYPLIKFLSETLWKFMRETKSSFTAYMTERSKRADEKETLVAEQQQAHRAKLDENDHENDNTSQMVGSQENQTGGQANGVSDIPIFEFDPNSEQGEAAPKDSAKGDNANGSGKSEDSIFQDLHLMFGKKKSKSEDNYNPPPLEIFQKTEVKKRNKYDKKELEQTAALLISTFKDFNIDGKIIGFQPGPVVTVYEFQPAAGIKQSKIIGLIDDLALALRVDSVFINPVKGKRALGVQVPNLKRDIVFLGDIIGSSNFQNAQAPLTFAMGKSLNGEVVCADLATTPHLLVAGSTGSGKSVGINALLCSIIMKSSPKDVRMILVDPKMLELSIYDGIPHLLMPVITEATRANLALKWAVNEMERRYKLMQNAAVRNIDAFNSFWNSASEDQKDEIKTKVEDPEITTLPYILLVIDELADLMLSAPKEIESIIQRLAQKARASGIHMVLATQRPSVDIITGVIKANLPTRIAFQVVSKHDSRTILDQMGADKLLGKGDMLFQRPGVSQLERIQGALVNDKEVVDLVKHLKEQDNAEYDDKLINWIDEEADKQSEEGLKGSESDDADAKWDDAISIGQKHGVISASFLQRHLKIGYNRAARIVESMESQGLVAKQDGSKPRKWLGPVCNSSELSLR